MSINEPIKNAPEIELISIPSKLSNHTFKLINDYKNLPQVLENLESIIENLNNLQELLLLKFQIEEKIIEINAIERQEVNKLCKNKSAVIVIESLFDDQSIIFWKVTEIEDFLVFKSSEQSNQSSNEIKKLNAFISNFLTDSVKNGHLGKKHLFKNR